MLIVDVAHYATHLITTRNGIRDHSCQVQPTEPTDSPNVSLPPVFIVGKVNVFCP